jgi:hypothetical protein
MTPGDPISYLALEPGTPVLGSDGEKVGVVERVVSDEATNIFEGLVIDTRLGPGGWRFADASKIAEMRTDAVELTLPAEEAKRLPKRD